MRGARDLMAVHLCSDRWGRYRLLSGQSAVPPDWTVLRTWYVVSREQMSQGEVIAAALACASGFEPEIGVDVKEKRP